MAEVTQPETVMPELKKVSRAHAKVSRVHAIVSREHAIVSREHAIVCRAHAKHAKVLFFYFLPMSL